MNLSVIIINYNTFELTCHAIQSIVETTKGCSYEIILVDNNSSECSSELFKLKFPFITLISSSENVGFAGGNNLGLKQAKGEYILLLNSDTVVLNDAVSIAYNYIVNNPTIGVLSGRLLYPDGTDQPVAGRFPSLKTEILEFLRFPKVESFSNKSKRLLGTYWDYNKGVDADWVWGTFFMFKTEILHQFPNEKLQDDFFMYYEDVQWCYYIKNTLKLRIVYIPEPRILHYLSRSTESSDRLNVVRNKVLPNEFKFLKSTKGVFYTLLYYWVKRLHLYSLRTDTKIEEANWYGRFINKMKNE
ncbi:MAG: glycosyltransferase family 2 protein [Cytophagaceae bacterium]